MPVHGGCGPGACAAIQLHLLLQDQAKKDSEVLILAEIFDIRYDADITYSNGKITIYLIPAMNIDIEGVFPITGFQQLIWQ
jgi:hypothetical protein